MTDASPVDTVNVESQTLLDVMPTVFVALGGTGMEILLRLRRRILQHNWANKSLMSLDEFPPARFVYFDTDTAEARESGKAGATDLLAARVAFAKFETLQKKVDTAHFMSEVDNYPHIAEWLPDGALDQIKSEKGAGQVRSISRLLFFDQYANFMSLMRTQAERVTQNVTNEPVLTSLGLKTQNRLRVVVVGSSAGGTGSGSFIDVGYALSSMRTPKIDQLDLFLMLPGGYRDANKDRVFANTYAALSELEFAMRGTRNPPYVQRWNDYARPEPEVRSPYNDVYLFDRTNVANQQTGVKEDLFDMIADILFEDFGSSEFARKKRTVSVNQEQHKITNYFPPLPDWMKDGLSYSKGYSSIGQTTLISKTSIQVEEHLSQNNAAMVRTFFGLSLGGQQKLAKTEDRDAFLQDRLRLRPKAFADEYDQRARFEQSSITDYDLVDFLLLREDKNSVALTLGSEIEQSFADVLTRIHDHKAWDAEVRKIVEARQRDVEGRVGEGFVYGPKGMEIARQRERFEAQLLDRTGTVAGSLRNEFYEILDDQERGGLEYTIDLITKIQARLAENQTGIIARLKEAEEAYAVRANRLNSEQLQASIDRLQQAANGSFLFGGGGRKSAERYLGQVRDDLVAALRSRLRSIACREAILLLQSTIQFLGNPQGLDDKGETTWTGLVGEFQAGRRRVRGLLNVIDADSSRLQDALRRGDGGTFFVIEDKGFEIQQESPDTQLGWAREAFEGIGGSKEIFQRLESDDGRLEILSLLRSVSNRRLGDYRKRIPSIVDALRQLSVPNQQRLMERLVMRAMPWISSDFSRGFRPSNEHYKMFIAVDGTKRFRAEFDEMIRSRLPGQSGISSVAYEESGVPGRIVCYCELSGIPLDAIASLRSEWRPSYLIEQSKSDGLPLHNHRDYLRYPDPIVPNLAELDELRERMKFFLRAVMLGKLRFNPGKNDRAGGDKRPAYEMEETRNQWIKVGDERKIRRHGFQPSHRDLLSEQVKRAESDLTYAQMLALIALSRWYADRVYTRKQFEVDGVSRSRGGIGFHASRELEQDFSLEAQRIGGTPPAKLSVADAVNRLYDRIYEWTDVVAGSIDDVSDTEVGRGPEYPVDIRATDKRSLTWAKFNEDAILSMISGDVLPAGLPASSAPPAAPSQRYWLYNVEGQVVGPFDVAGFQMIVQLGQLNGEMKVCAEGSQTWQTIASIPALAALLRAPTSPAPPPPPTN